MRRLHVYLLQTQHKTWTTCTCIPIPTMIYHLIDHTIMRHKKDNWPLTAYREKCLYSEKHLQLLIHFQGKQFECQRDVRACCKAGNKPVTCVLHWCYYTQTQNSNTHTPINGCYSSKACEKCEKESDQVFLPTSSFPNIAVYDSRECVCVCTHVYMLSRHCPTGSTSEQIHPLNIQ